MYERWPRLAPSPAEAVCRGGISFDEAQAALLAGLRPLGSELVPLDQADGRLLAEPVIARIAAPRADLAAMDGYAIAAEGEPGQLMRLRLVGDSYPGGPVPAPLGAGEALRIFTGAPLPPGAARVVMQEVVRTNRDHILFVADPGAKPHCREKGSDFHAGTPLLPAGRRVDPQAMVVAASADHAVLSVRRQARVFLIATGDELVTPGLASATERLIPDSLSRALGACVARWGGRVVGRAMSPDDPEALTRIAAQGLLGADVLLLIGGTSTGDRDYGRTAMAHLGAGLTFAGVAMKPGKPVCYGRVGRAHILALPGNPTAALTVAHLFLAPLLAALEGARQGEDGGEWQPAPLLSSCPVRGDYEQFLCATLGPDGVRVIDRQSASAQATLAMTNALVRLRPGITEGREGEYVEVLRL